MSRTSRKWPRYFAIVIALVMITETIAFTMTSYAKNDTSTAYALNDGDKVTVSEISNMTGVRAEEIIKLRKMGKTWNEILEHIKSNPGYRDEGDGARRSNILEKDGIAEEAIEKLKAEGFTEEEISAVKSLAERVMFQLEEISNMQVMAPSQPEAGVNGNEDKEEDMTDYTELSEKINLNEAVYFALKLRDVFGGMQGALDEYLCSLQLGIDLKLYLTDKESYLEQRQQKLAELSSRDIITAAGLEEKMLDMLQSLNKKAEELPEIKDRGLPLPEASIESPLPEVQAPDLQDIKPQNPAEAILKEIENINNSNGEQDRR